jgi:Flp pilus assembly protein TadG
MLARYGATSSNFVRLPGFDDDSIRQFFPAAECSAAFDRSPASAVAGIQRHRGSPMRKLFRRFLVKDKEGATAIEFALLALPFFIMLFGVMEVALMFFTDSTLSAALQTSVREIRTGSAQSAALNINSFKAKVCNNMAYAFNCSTDLLIRADVLTDMSSVNYATAVSAGTISVTEGFNIGGTGDFVLVQAFLPWSRILTMYGTNDATLADGRYVLAAAALFKNEPF